MKPSRRPAGKLSLRRGRLKARERYQMTCVSTVQQGRAVFAALINSAQQVWKTFDLALMLICPENTAGFSKSRTVSGWIAVGHCLRCRGTLSVLEGEWRRSGVCNAESPFTNLLAFRLAVSTGSFQSPLRRA